MSLETRQDGLTLRTHKKLLRGEWVTQLEVTQHDRGDRLTRVNLSADTTRQLSDQLDTIAKDMGR